MGLASQCQNVRNAPVCLFIYLFATCVTGILRDTMWLLHWPSDSRVKAKPSLGTLHMSCCAAFCYEIPHGDSSVLGAGVQVFKNLIFLIKYTRGGQALSIIQEDSLFGFPSVHSPPHLSQFSGPFFFPVALEIVKSYFISTLPNIH